MPSRSDLPSEIKREKFSKALSRLGFEINKQGGKGSHYKATHVRTQKMVTIPSELDKDTLYYLLREIERYSGVTWDDIKGNL
jgi:predicted RNA binding protein YcfA (HicA-like mRNA interferase family)